ncbi:MAG TPA: hypothetical protein VF120_18125 [Ktedonobacterales bacterium]
MDEQSEFQLSGEATRGQPIMATEALGQLRRLGQTVARIGAACGLSAEQLARFEAREVLECRTRLSVEHVCGPAFAPLGEWFALLGDDLTLSLVLAGYDPDADPGAPFPEAQLEADTSPVATFTSFCERARQVAATQGDDIVVELRLRVGKRRAHAAMNHVLASRGEYLGAPEAMRSTGVAVYYSAAAIYTALSLRALLALEAQSIVQADGRLVIGVCDASGYLAGLALEVIGAGLPHPPDWLTVSRAAWRAFLAREAAVRRLRDEEGSWPDPPRALTPEYLRLTSRQPGLERISVRVEHTRAELAAAYLASAVSGDRTSGLILRFAGPRPSSVTLPSDDSADATSSVAEDTLGPGSVARARVPSRRLWDAREPSDIANGTSDDPRTLARLAAWAYRDASSEKLAIARECLARELPAGETVSLATLERAALPALESAKANFLLYVRRNIEQYFRVRQSAQDAVAAYAATVRTSVGDLTGEVVGNLYRTVGVLAAALLAGLLQPSVSLSVLRLATGLYALYMAFLLAVMLRATRDRFRLEREALATRLAAMPELSASERGRLSLPARAADAYFRHYFALTLGIYAALGIISLLLFALLWTPLAPALSLPHAKP